MDIIFLANSVSILADQRYKCTSLMQGANNKEDRKEWDMATLY